MTYRLRAQCGVSSGVSSGVTSFSQNLGVLIRYEVVIEEWPAIRHDGEHISPFLPQARQRRVP